MGLFKDSSKNHTCPTHSLAENALEPFIGDTSFYHFNMIVSGSCAAFASFVIIILMSIHATHLSKPNEQIKIMKIACLIPFYSLFSFISICYPKSEVSIAPWLDLVQALALGSFFLLMCEFVSESRAQRDVFFSALLVPDKKSGENTGGLIWYRRKWIMIFQYPVVALLASLATDITQAAGIYCQYVSKPYFAKLWISLARGASLVVAVLSVLKFYLTLKNHLASHQPLAKLMAFKLVVMFTFLEGVIFWILTDAKLLNPTSTLTYADLNIGIPNMIICIIMVPLSLFFCYAYSWRPYLISRTVATEPGTGLLPPTYYGGFLGFKAWIRALNPTETVKAICFAFQVAAEDRKRGDMISDSSAEYNLLPHQDGRQRC